MVQFHGGKKRWLYRRRKIANHHLPDLASEGRGRFRIGDVFLRRGLRKSWGVALRDMYRGGTAVPKIYSCLLTRFVSDPPRFGLDLDEGGTWCG